MEDIQFKKNYSALISPDYRVGISSQKSGVQKTAPNGGDFAGILQDRIRETGQVTFSKHALQRMDSRKIEVSPQLVSQMSDAVAKARDKGVKDALILSGSTAFIVNVPSGTVITTMSGGEMKDNIFTNIDGAVIL